MQSEATANAAQQQQEVIPSASLVPTRCQLGASHRRLGDEDAKPSEATCLGPRHSPEPFLCTRHACHGLSPWRDTTVPCLHCLQLYLLYPLHPDWLGKFGVHLSVLSESEAEGAFASRAGELSVGLRRRSLLGSGTGQHQILGNLVEMSDVLLCEVPPVPCNLSLTELAVGARACPGTRAGNAYARLVDRRLRGARLPRSCTDYLAVGATLRTHSPNTHFEVELLDQVLPALQLRCLKL